MQRGQKSPEGALYRQLEDLQDAREHGIFGHEPNVVQAGEADVDRQDQAQNKLVHRHRTRNSFHSYGFFHQLLKLQLLQHRGHREQAAVGSQVLTLEVIGCVRIDFAGLASEFARGLWDGRLTGMLRTVYHHLGDSWKWAHEASDFAASLFYDSISGVSKWFFLSGYVTATSPTANSVHRSTKTIQQLEKSKKPFDRKTLE